MTAHPRPPTPFPAHPIVLLEPVVHLALGAMLLGWWGGDRVATILGLGFLGAGFGFGLPAIRKYWGGVFTITPDAIETRSGILFGRRVSIPRSEVTRVAVRRGAGGMRYDPVHALLHFVGDHGAVEVAVRSGRVHALAPVALTEAHAAVQAWADGADRPVPARSTWLLHVLLAAGVLGCGVAALAQGDGWPANTLFGAAAVLEVAFWSSLIGAWVRKAQMHRPG